MLVTLYKNGVNPGDVTHVEASAVVEDIRSGKYAELIEMLNSFTYDSPEQKDFKKSKLPAIGWNGVFEYRANDKLKVHSGLIAIDFDKIPDDEIQKYICILSSDKYTYALFRSPRRNGLKCIVRIPADVANHRFYARGLRKHYNSRYYDHFEDESRLCYVSHDPNIYFNPDAVEWNVRDMGLENSGSKTNNANKIEDSSEIQNISREIFDMLIKWELNKGNYYEDGNKHKYLVSLFSGCNRFGIPKNHAAKLALDKYHNFPGTSFVNENDFIRICEKIYSTYSEKFNTVLFNPAPKSKENTDDDVFAMSFPVEVFPGDIQNYINELNRTLKYSKDFLSIAVMFAVATLNGNKFKLKVKNGWIAPTTFWFMAVGEPGTMKTHPLNTIIKPLSHLDKESKHIYDRDVDEWEQMGSKGKRPKYRQILLSDYTIEALHEVHSFNRRGLGLYKDEIVGFLNDMNKYRKGSDEQFWLESFNNQSYQINRVSKEPIRIDNIMINVIGSIQPAVLSDVAKSYHGNGLIDRFLYTAAEENIYPMGVDDIDPGWFVWWNEKMKLADSWFSYVDESDSHILEIDADCMGEMINTDQYFVNIQKSEDETNEIKNYLSKMKTYLPRFALLLGIIDTLIEGTDLYINKTHFKRARKICEYFIASARYVFSEADKAEEIGNVKKASNGKTKIEQIMELSGKGFKQSQIAKTLHTPASYVSKVIATYTKKTK